MMAFLPLTSVLHLDKRLLRLGKASHDDLPAQILPFPSRAFHLYQNATVQKPSGASNDVLVVLHKGPLLLSTKH